MATRIWIAFGAASFGWGTAGVAVRAAFDEGVTPIAMVALRAIIATVALFAFLHFVRGSVPRSRDEWKVGAVMSVFNLSLPFILFTLGLQYASAGFMGLLAALMPVATAIFAHFLLPDDPLYSGKVIGLLVAFGGVAFLSLTGDSGLDEGGRPMLALALGLGAVLCVGVSNIYAKKQSAGYDPVEVTAMQFALGSLILVPLTLLVEGLPSEITGIAWVLLAYLGLAGSVVPFLAYYWVLQHVSVTRAQIIAYLVPLVALTTGIIVLDERIEIGIAVGGALILAGVIITGAAERRFVRA
ncbi:MAG: DMT family transporter [Acidimicrobiia bacterium]|nr:DMT family transporter [Acidimicrobiia bacterium]